MIYAGIRPQSATRKSKTGTPKAGTPKVHLEVRAFAFYAGKMQLDANCVNVSAHVFAEPNEPK